MNKEKTKKTIFASAVAIVFIFLIIAVFSYPDVIKDDIFSLAVIILFYFIDKKYPLPISIIICGLIPPFLNTVGVPFGFFNFYPFGIGYDKLIHFAFNLLGTLVLFHILKHITKRQIVATIIIAIFVVNGIGSMGKLIEFAGSTYVKFQGSSMFSMGDGNVPSSAIQNLVIYDPWWDLIFGFFGTLTAGAILLAHKRKYEEEYDIPCAR